MPVFCYDELSKKEAGVVNVNSVFLEEILSPEVLEEEVLIGETEEYFKTKVPRYIGDLYLQGKIWPRWVLLIRRRDFFYEINRITKSRWCEPEVCDTLIHLGVYHNLQEVIEILKRKYYMDEKQLLALLRRMIDNNIRKSHPGLYRWILREINKLDIIRVYDI